MGTDKTQETADFDPETKTITDPEDGKAFAFFKGETKEAIVYSNDFSFSLARKVVLSNGKLDKEKSTKQPTSNLLISKTFYFDTKEPIPENVEEILMDAGIDYKNGNSSITAPSFYKKNLYLQKTSSYLIFDNRLLQDGHIVEYVISGQNIGTDTIQEVVVLDVLPLGFTFMNAEYWFTKRSSPESSDGYTSVAVMTPNAFESKQVVQDGKTALVFRGQLPMGLKPGEEFRIKVTVTLDLETLPIEFDEDSEAIN